MCVNRVACSYPSEPFRIHHKNCRRSSAIHSGAQLDISRCIVTPPLPLPPQHCQPVKTKRGKFYVDGPTFSKRSTRYCGQRARLQGKRGGGTLHFDRLFRCLGIFRTVPQAGNETRATMLRLLSDGPRFGSLRPLPKTDRETNHNRYGSKNAMAWRHNKNHAPIFDDCM